MAFGGLWAAQHQGLYTGSDWHVNTQACGLSVLDEKERGGRIGDPGAPPCAQTHPGFGFTIRSTRGTRRHLTSLTSQTDVCERESESERISTRRHYKPAQKCFYFCVICSMNMKSVKMSSCQQARHPDSSHAAASFLTPPPQLE